MKKAIVLDVAGTELTFTPTPQDYDESQNEMLQGDAAASAHNFVMRSVSDDSKEALRELVESNPGASMQLYGEVMKQFAPKLKITVKK
ncbi:putative phage tail assembly chaperone [Photobacterium sagamiensis]|uniref:putative phage tail assembly chaperone n=1 Tax=Photobacterium sagamiensis TaxID=2910241 RepID=UPI003D0E1F2F